MHFCWYGGDLCYDRQQHTTDAISSYVEVWEEGCAAWEKR